MTALLSVFPDTNLFLQCKPLKELDWTLLGHKGEIELLITRPVQTELDALKARGNSRQASKSRAASTLIAELLDASEEGLVLKYSPTVRLRMARTMRPDPVVETELNYDSRDDQLVGIALSHHKANTDGSTLLLTYDHGPMFSARDVGLPYKKIPETWLLAPEPDDAARREGALKSELERYQKSEPKFEMGPIGEAWQAFELSFEVYSSLSDEVIDFLLDRVFSDFPEATDFGPSEPFEKQVEKKTLTVVFFGEEKEVFTPASDEEINNYKRRYAEWKEVCKSYLKDIHNTLNKRLKWPALTPRISNVGSRPADGALVELKASGAIHIVRPRWRDDDEPKLEETLKFPRPPAIPKGHLRRIKRTSSLEFHGVTDALASLSAKHGSLNTLPSVQDFTSARDPNGFYWKAGAQGVPLNYLSLECEQWRHACEPEDFKIGLRFPREKGMHSGSLTVIVHAANLTNPFCKNIPIRVSVATISPKVEVEKQVEELLSSPRKSFLI